MAASSWQQAAQQDGVLHLPSPLRQRNTCKRAILAWEATHGTRLSACRKWLRRHPKRVLQGGGNIPNVAGVLIHYQQRNDTVTRTFWNVKKGWSTHPQDLQDVLIKSNGAQTAQSAAAPQNGVFVLWVRHCFGCHNLKESISTLQEFSYRWFNYTSLCTTDGKNIQDLHNSAQALKGHTAQALGDNIQYKYYSSILPRAMMTAQFVKRSITDMKANAKFHVPEAYQNHVKSSCLNNSNPIQSDENTSDNKTSNENTSDKNTSDDKTSDDKTSDNEIRRMWYVSEKHNLFESLWFRWFRIILFPFLSLYYLMIPSQKQPGTQWFGDDGLNKLNLAASTKWATKLNTWFKEDRISTQPPLGNSPGLLPAFLTYDALPAFLTYDALPAFLTYDAPSLMEWEKKVLPKLFDEEQKEAKTVHLIVTHGKTLTAYLKKCGLTV